MKFTVLCFLAVVAYATCRPDENKYTDQYDSLNIQEILGNKKLVEFYIMCALDKGRCNAEGRELKSHIQDALETGCAKCTTVQQDQSKVVFEHLVNHEPKYWNDLKEKYDPTGKYSAKYDKELKSIIKA